MRGLLLLLLALPASSGPYADCLTDPATKKPREEFEPLRECQRRTRAAFEKKKDKKGRGPSVESLERFDDHQRAEARKFFENPLAEVSGGATGTTLIDSDAPEAPAAGSAGKAGLGGLEGRLKAAAGDGSAGITPAMVRDILATLKAQQGGVSGPMKELLDAVTRDGGKLTPDTMKKLQDAAKSAKGAGLDLGIDPKIEKGLLESDFSLDKVPAAPASPNAL